MRSLVTLMAAFALVTALATPVAAAPCQFVLGFKVLHDLMPNAIGDCLVDEHHNPANGDGLQETAGDGGGLHTGLLVWRKADNWTAYTDGNQTWINGPFGLESRFNVQRFPWEPDALHASQVVPESAVEVATCAALPRDTRGGALGLACLSIYSYNYTVSHPAPTVPIAPTPVPKPVIVGAPPYVPAPITTSTLRGLYRVALSRLDQDFYRDDGGTLFDTSGCDEYAYSEPAIFDANRMKILFNSAMCDVSNVATQSIHTQIEGDFNGFDFEAVFSLTNGQVWQEVSATYDYHYAYRPEVFIYVAGGSVRMHVVGVDMTVNVRRLA